MTRRSKRLIRKARQILMEYGISDYDNIYPVDEFGNESIHVARFTSSKNNVIYLKDEVKFKRAAKAFKEETGINMVKIW